MKDQHDLTNVQWDVIKASPFGDSVICAGFDAEGRIVLRSIGGWFEGEDFIGDWLIRLADGDIDLLHEVLIELSEKHGWDYSKAEVGS